MMKQQIKITVQLTALERHDDEHGIFVTWCPALDLFAQGDTLDEAKAALEDQMVLFVEMCYRRGILDNVLVERGFQPADPNAPALVPGAFNTAEFIAVQTFQSKYDVSIQVPLHLVAGMKPGMTRPTTDGVRGN